MVASETRSNGPPVALTHPRNTPQPDAGRTNSVLLYDRAKPHLIPLSVDEFGRLVCIMPVDVGMNVVGPCQNSQAAGPWQQALGERVTVSVVRDGAQ